MKVVLIEPKKLPKVLDIEDDLKEYQRIVGGYIECIYDVCNDGKENRIIGIINDEGKLDGLEPNRYIYDGKDVICGNMILTADDFNGGFTDLNEDEIKLIKNKFKDIPEIKEIPEPVFEFYTF